MGEGMATMEEEEEAESAHMGMGRKRWREVGGEIWTNITTRWMEAIGEEGQTDMWKWIC
jgi:hypothetical protein